MLHPPYTFMVFSFVTMGAAISRRFSLLVLVASLAAYFLGLGIGAHFLDQITGMGSRFVRHWSDRALWAIGLAALAGGVAIGVAGAILVAGPGLLLLVAIQAACAVGYPLAPLFRGVLHRDSVFAISWGSLPFLTSYYAQSGTITIPALVSSAALAGIAVAEIRISRVSRSRRQIERQRQEHRAPDDGFVGRSYRRADAVLQAIVASTGLMALGLLASRLLVGA